MMMGFEFASTMLVGQILIPSLMFGVAGAFLVLLHVGHFKRRREVLRMRDSKSPTFLIALSDLDPRYSQLRGMGELP